MPSRFRRDHARHRVRYVADLPGGRYEVELLGERWLVRVSQGAQLRAIGRSEGYAAYEEAVAAALADAGSRARSSRWRFRARVLPLVVTLQAVVDEVAALCIA